MFRTFHGSEDQETLVAQAAEKLAVAYRSPVNKLRVSLNMLLALTNDKPAANEYYESLGPEAQQILGYMIGRATAPFRFPPSAFQQSLPFYTMREDKPPQASKEFMRVKKSFKDLPAEARRDLLVQLLNTELSSDPEKA